MRLFVFLFAFIYFLAAWPTLIKTEYDSSVKIYPEIDLSAKSYPGNSVLLEWKTQRENQLYGFEILRKSLSGDFNTIGFVPAYGDNNGHAYRFVDLPDAPGNLIYRIRLKLIDSEEQDILSPRLEFDFHPKKSLSNLIVKTSDDGYDIAFFARDRVQLKASILSNSGNDISTIAQGTFAPGRHHIFWNGKDEMGRPLPEGIYVLKLRTRKEEMTRELILDF